MSVSSSLDFKFQKRTSIREVVIPLMESGWRMENDGLINYLPVGDDGDFEWKKDAISRDSVLDIFNEKENSGEIVGVVMLWENTNIGGEFLFHSALNLSVLLSINRRVSLCGVTDATWYLERLIPAFKTIESFEFSEHM